MKRGTGRSWSTIVLVVGHAMDDLYQGAVPALVPFMVAERHFGYVAAAGITLAATLLSSVMQPLFGLLTDRRGMPWLVPVGMIVAGVGIGLSGLSTSYPLTWLAIALSGLGVAAYHPESARLARVATGGSHVGMSLFSVGGNVGYALGPVMVTPVITAVGLAGTPLLIGPAVAGGLLSFGLLRRLSVNGKSTVVKAMIIRRDDWIAFIRLTFVVVCRSVVSFGLSTFLALYVQQRLHEGAAASEVALGVMFFSGALGALLGGVLAGRFGRVRTMRFSYAATVLFLVGLVFVPGPVIYVFVAAAAITLFVPFSLQVTLGQDYLPNRIGTASGVTLGVAVSVGGIAAPALGVLAKVTSLQLALTALIPLAALCWFAALNLTEPSHSETSIGDREAEGASFGVPADSPT